MRRYGSLVSVAVALATVQPTTLLAQRDRPPPVEWTPYRSQIEQVERALARTVYTCEPFRNYARVYSGIVVGRGRLIVGTLLSFPKARRLSPPSPTESIEPSEPGIYVVPLARRPFAIGPRTAPSCGRIPIEYDVKLRRFTNF